MAVSSGLPASFRRGIVRATHRICFPRGSTQLAAVGKNSTQEVTDEGDRGDGSGRGNGRDEAGGAARAAVGAALVMPGLTAWQGLFEHGRLRAGQSVLVHGAAGVVGSMATQLAREAGAYVIGTGRAGGRQTALDFGAQEFVDLDNDALEDVGAVDLVFDVLGGDIAKRSAGVIRAGGTLVTIAGPTEARPSGGLTIDFVVVPDRAQLSELVQRARTGRLRTNIGKVAALDEAVAAFNPTERIKGKTIIRVRQ